MKRVRGVKKTRRNKVRRHNTRRVKGGDNGNINWNKITPRNRGTVVSYRPPKANQMEAQERLQQLHEQTAKKFELHNKVVAQGVPTEFIQDMKKSYRNGFNISTV